MNKNEIQPEIDEELAEAGKLFIKAVEAQASRAGFVRALNSLPNEAVTNSNNQRYLYQPLGKLGVSPLGAPSTSFSFINKLFNYINMKFLSGKFASAASTALLILVVIYGFGTWYLSGQQASNTSSSGEGQIGVTTDMAVPAEVGQMTGLGTNESFVGKAVNSIRATMMPAPAPDYYPYYGGTPNANDTREFNKIYYRANIKTRDVAANSQRAQTMVRGYQGRVDSANTDYKYAYISFVIPKASYEQFKTELRGLAASARFFNESITTQNLLGQKQNIEEQHANLSDNVDEVQKQKTDLIAKHKIVIASLQSQRGKIINELNLLSAEVTTDTVRLQQIEARKTYLVSERNRLSQNIDNENSQYNYQLANLDQQIKNLNAGIKNMEKQDQNLLANVETVNGTVSLQWISVWAIINLYIPHFGFWLVLVVAAIIFFITHRNKKVEMVEMK